MGKHEKIRKLIGAQLAECPLKLVPDFYTSTGNEEFIRVSVLLGPSDVNIRSSTGIIKFDIFTRDTPPPKVLDYLEGALVGQNLGDCVSLLSGASGTTKPDTNNQSLRVTPYMITINYYGVM